MAHAHEERGSDTGNSARFALVLPLFLCLSIVYALALLGYRIYCAPRGATVDPLDYVFHIASIVLLAYFLERSVFVERTRFGTSSRRTFSPLRPVLCGAILLVWAVIVALELNSGSRGGDHDIIDIVFGGSVLVICAYQLQLDVRCYLAEHWRSISMAARDGGDYGGALRMMDRCVRIFPRHGYFRALRGWIQQLREEYRSAIEDYIVAEDLGYRPRWLYANRASAYCALGYVKKARTDERRAE